MKTYWEDVPTPLNGFIAYLCVPSALPVLKPRKSQRREIVGNILFDSTHETANADDVVKAGEHEYTLRLPYNARMLQARYERGEDVPTWFILPEVA